MKHPSRFFSGQKFVKLALSLMLIFSFVFSNAPQTVHAAGTPLKVVGRFLQDANGNDIMMRGVNVPVYKSGWDVNDLDAVAQAIATTRTNVARLEWWANPPTGTEGVYTVANLDLAIQKYVDLGILPMIELHDLTYQYGQDAKPGNPPSSNGNDQTIFANTITDFWTRADVLPILISHQDHLIINLANEWGSSTYSDDGSSTAANFIQNYTNAITAMRNAGINAPLVVDAPKGFEYQFILDNGQAILDGDPQSNTMLSVHAYWAANYYSNAQIDTMLDAIQNSGLPIILGEVSSNAWTNVQCDPVNYGHLLTKANTNQIGYLIWSWYEDGTCGLLMNMTVNQDGVTIPTSASFGYNTLNGSGYGINTATPLTSPIETVPSAAPTSKVLVANRAIATWPGNVPVAEKRPVLVFLPGWGGVGAVNANVNAQNTALVNQGYVTLAIGFDSSATWISDIAAKTKNGLDLLCADASIPADCSAIALVGSSYGSAQNYWVIEHLRSNGYDGAGGSTGSAIAFLSQDSGYGAPGTLDDVNTGAYTRTGLADTAAYSVALIENLGDTTFPVDECTWGNCGARTLGDAHLARGDQNVFSICPAGGGHGTRGFANWNAWVTSALKTMIHGTGGVATFTGYTPPTLTVANECISGQAEYTLTVTSDHGTVTLDPDQATYHAGDLVTLTATPNPGWVFDSWSGDLTGSTNPDSITINGNTSVTANYTAIIYTARIYSMGVHDGWALESTETSGLGSAVNTTATTFALGNSASKQQFRGILSFNTSSLPDDAVISTVVLKVKKQGVVGGGDPLVTLQGFMTDIKTGFFGTLPALQAADFQAVANRTLGPASPSLVSGSYFLSLTNGKAYINTLASNNGVTQIRLRFKLDDHNIAQAKYLSLYSGNAALATDRPQLVVTYTLP